MSLRHIVKKAVRSVKKHVKNLPRSFDLRPGHGKASIFNPYTHALFSARKVVKGMRHKKWQANMSKAMQGGSRHYVPYSYSASVGATTGTEYVHNARTLSQMTGGR